MVKLSELPSSGSKAYLVLCLGPALGWSYLYNPDSLFMRGRSKHFWGQHMSFGPPMNLFTFVLKP